MQARVLMILAMSLAVLGLSEGSRDSMCSQLQPQKICKVAWPGFEFTDGCNRIECGADGNFMSTTRMCRGIDLERCSMLMEGVFKRIVDSVCKQLAPEVVCATAPRDFRFTDGCNFFRCDGSGDFSGSRQACEEAPSIGRKADACKLLTKSVESDLPNVQCAVNATEICLRAGENYTFNDGCNGVTCMQDGNYATTMMFCEPAPAKSLTCQLVEEETMPQQEQQQNFACENLQPDRICNRSIAGFSYSDGCNTMRCVGDGDAISTQMFCPSDSANDTASVRYCEEMQDRYERKLEQSSARSECLKPEDVCRGAAPETSYYDGCNRCMCMSDTEAACTRMACREFFGTDEEFKEHCKRIRAGVIGGRV